MNEKTNIDKHLTDQHVHELLNAGIDGELNAMEQAELDELMANSEQARDLHEQLTVISELLDRVPEREPPEYLQSAIEKQVRLPVVDSGSEGGRGVFGSWLNANWLRTGFALAAGVVLTVGVYEMGSEPISDQDSASLVGTVVKNPATNQGDLLGSILLNTDALNGVVELRNNDELFVLDIQLNSDVSSEVIVDFSGSGLVFEDISWMPEDNRVINGSSGLVKLNGTGEQYYSMSLRRTSVDEQIKPLNLEFFADSKLVQEAKLSVSQH